MTDGEGKGQILEHNEGQGGAPKLDLNLEMVWLFPFKVKKENDNKKGQASVSFTISKSVYDKPP